jgi:hypothetical protein
MYENVKITHLKFSVGGVVWTGMAQVPDLVTGAPLVMGPYISLTSTIRVNFTLESCA